MIRFILFLLIATLISWGIYECKFASTYWMDSSERPWAYSNDPNASVLPGIWEGVVKDPNGLIRKVIIEIFEPHTMEERERKATRRSRKRKIQQKDLRLFNGEATAESKSGKEKYLLSGSVQESDFHQLKVNFRAADENKRIPGFNLLYAKTGRWHRDSLELDLEFAWFRPDGSSFSDSADPRYSHVERVTFTRNKIKSLSNAE